MVIINQFMAARTFPCIAREMRMVNDTIMSAHFACSYGIINYKFILGGIFDENNQDHKYLCTKKQRCKRRMRWMPDFLPERLQNILYGCKPEMWKKLIGNLRTSELQKALHGFCAKPSFPISAGQRAVREIRRTLGVYHWYINTGNLTTILLLIPIPGLSI